MSTRDAVVEVYSISQGLATKGYEGEPGASMIKCEDTPCSTTAQPRYDVPGNTTGITETVAKLASSDARAEINAKVKSKKFYPGDHAVPHKVSFRLHTNRTMNPSNWRHML